MSIRTELPAEQRPATAMELEFIEYVVDGHVAHVTIDRPERRNALNQRCHVELRRVFETFRDDAEQWVAILTGRGDRAFCAGADLSEARSLVSAEVDDKAVPVPWGGITRDLACWKPVIAAVNGFALGGGTELALACDIVVAADSAQFGLPEVRRGLAAGAGGLIRLPRQLPLKQAMALILTGEPISAETALTLGLINEVVPFKRLQEAAHEWAERIQLNSPHSVRLSKRVALSYLHLDVDEAMAAQQSDLAELRESPDTIEGLRAFAEKREPIWTGR